MKNFDIAKNMITAYKSYIESFMNSKDDRFPTKGIGEAEKGSLYLWLLRQRYASFIHYILLDQ